MRHFPPFRMNVEERIMPPKTHKTAVIIIPPETVWSPIQAIRQQHDRQVRRWMPHITLLYPFRPRDAFATVAPALEQVCASMSPFPVTLAQFRTFPQARGRYTLWLAPEPAAALVDLQTALGQIVPDCDDTRRFRHGFTPHLSVGQVHGRDTMLRLVAALQNDWSPVQFTVADVCLIWRNDPPDDQFRVAQRLPLGSI
jgi:2'-5' RNA ligase